MTENDKERGRNEEGSGEGKVEDLELTSEKEGAISIIRMIRIINYIIASLLFKLSLSFL